MPRHLISDAHEWIDEIPTVCIFRAVFGLALFFSCLVSLRAEGDEILPSTFSNGKGELRQPLTVASGHSFIESLGLFPRESPLQEVESPTPLKQPHAVTRLSIAAL